MVHSSNSSSLSPRTAFLQSSMEQGAVEQLGCMCAQACVTLGNRKFSDVVCNVSVVALQQGGRPHRRSLEVYERRLAPAALGQLHPVEGGLCQRPPGHQQRRWRLKVRRQYPVVLSCPAQHPETTSRFLSPLLPLSLSHVLPSLHVLLSKTQLSHVALLTNVHPKNHHAETAGL